MGDPRRRDASDPDLDRATGATEAATASPTDGDWSPHPWAAVVARYGGDPDTAVGATEQRVTIIWWRTRAGRQPVLLVRRIRYD